MIEFELLRQIAGLLLVFALLGAAVYFLGRRDTRWQFAFSRAMRGARRMQVVDRLHLTPQHSLQIVRVGDRELLLALHPGGCNVLEGSAAASPAAGTGAR